MENVSDVWYIPQGVSLEIIRSILGHCYNSQKRNQPITGESIKKTIVKGEKTVGYALKMLENMGILTLNKENENYSLNEVSMSFAEKLITKEDLTKEINQIIENSFLGKILQIILNNETITKSQLVEKILLNSAAGMVKDHTPYMTTIYCILEILNLSGKIPEEKYLELRGNSEQAEKRTSPSTGFSPRKKKEKPTAIVNDMSLQSEIGSGIHGIVKTSSIEIKITNIKDLEFARLVLDKLEKEISNIESDNKSTSGSQITS